MTSPLTVLAPALIANPFPLALVTSISIIGLPAKPGWVVPSMITGSLIVGSTDAGAIVCTPAPAILKAMKSVPGVTFARFIAPRRVHLAVSQNESSSVELTTMAFAGASLSIILITAVLRPPSVALVR